MEEVTAKKQWPPDERVRAREFARCCADRGEEMAAYWLNEASSFMWGMCAELYLIPRVERIHALLVELGASEGAKLDFNDLDDDTFYIPVPDKIETYSFTMPDRTEPETYPVRTKVIVHSTQNRDYLYILTEEGSLSVRKRLDIRRIWRQFDPTDEYHMDWFTDASSSPAAMLALVGQLEEYSDYPRPNSHETSWRCDRPSLEMYRQLGFRIPSVDQPFEQINLYGDFRDHGYILSYEARTGFDVETHSELPAIDNEFISAEYASPEASLILNCLLPSLECFCE